VPRITRLEISLIKRPWWVLQLYGVHRNWWCLRKIRGCKPNS
jgi:hypothetical protein